MSRVSKTNGLSSAMKRNGNSRRVNSVASPKHKQVENKRRRTVDVGYPDDNPKTVLGLQKVSLSKVPAVAVVYEALAMMDGAKKYGPFNWRTKRVTASIYVDACKRHIDMWFDGEDNAADSGVPHLGHARACLAILIDAQETGNLNDDRPPKGSTAAAIARFTKKG